MKIRIALLLVVAALPLSAPAADWLGFRGSDNTGVAPGKENLPREWDKTKNIAWQAELPGPGLSAPIVIGDRVVVTTCSGHGQQRLHVICFNAADGSVRWHRQAWATGRTMSHPKTNMASCTPVSDGKQIYAIFSTNDLLCFDLDGKLQWLRGLTYDYPNASNSLGMASSPVVVGDTLVCQLETDTESFALGLDTATGENRWKIDRPAAANWASPVVLHGANGEDLVVLQGSKGLACYEPRTGRERWSLQTGGSSIPSSVAIGETIFAPINGLTALEAKTDSLAPKVLWQSNRLSSSTPSPLVYQGKVFTISRAGVISCANAKTGDLDWQLRLQGPFSGSPVAADGHIFLFNEAGLCQVIDPSGEKGEVVAENELGERILSTPAIADGAIYVRSDHRLWKIARGE